MIGRAGFFIRNANNLPGPGRVSGTTFASPEAFAKYVKKIPGGVVSLLPEQSLTINTKNGKTVGYVVSNGKVVGKNVGSNDVFTVGTHKQFPNSNVILTINGTATPGETIKARLDMMGVDGYKMSKEPVQTVPFTLKVLAR